MMEAFDRAGLERQIQARFSPIFRHISVAKNEDERGTRHIFLLPARLLTRDEVLAVCKEIALIVREHVSEKPDHWAVAIGVQRITGQMMAAYFLGWEGHVDEWRFFGRATDHADWLALHQRLRALLASRGVEKPEGESGGDFSLVDEDNGLPRLWLGIHRIEFLTSKLVAEIQAVLRDGYGDWHVVVGLYLPFSERISPEGIVIWADRIVEEWDRADLMRTLGDRLKI